MAVKDFDAPAGAVTSEQMADYFRRQRELESTNVIKLAGKVVSIRSTEPKPKMKADEKGNFVIPMLDDDGNAIYWDSMHYLTLVFEGGSVELPISSQWQKEINQGQRILLEGSKIADKKGIVKDVYHRFVVLV